MGHEQFSQVSALGSGNEHPKVLIHIGHVDTCDSLTPVEAVADTGAMTNVWGLADYKKAGLSVKRLQPTSAVIRAANGHKIDIDGQFHAIVKGKSPNNEDIVTKTIIYVSKSVNGMFLSKDSMTKLFIIGEEFPVIGQCKTDKNVDYDVLCNSLDNEGKRELLSGCSNTQDSSNCYCPQRTAVPPKPKTLPYLLPQS